MKVWIPVGPRAEVRLDAGSITPGTCDDVTQSETSLGQKVFHALLGPAATVGRMVVHPEQERCCDNQDSMGPHHLPQVADCPIGPEDVLENLFYNYYVEIFIESSTANIVVGVADTTIALEPA